MVRIRNGLIGMIAQRCIQNIHHIIKYLWCTTWPHDDIPDTCNFFLDTSKNKPSTAAKRILHSTIKLKNSNGVPAGPLCRFRIYCVRLYLVQ